MAPGTAENAVSAKRAQIAGKSGIKGLISNGKTFSVALFASLGGLVYGCEYEYRLSEWIGSN